MNYKETLQFLYEHLPLFSRNGAKAYKADLGNTLKICEFIDNPQHKIKMIHVAGTNGKGSCSHMLAAILSENGYKTGLYTSPHLRDFRERIKINGTEIAKDHVIGFVERTRQITKEVQPSFFELTFAMALDYFAENEVQIAIIETGLGGRLDSTNIIKPLLSIITNIGLDHTDILGNTHEAIAYEKAGIIKPGIPVVIGQAIPETMPVFIEKAQAAKSEITFTEEVFSVLSVKTNPHFLDVEVFDHQNSIKEKYKLDLQGLYQTKNLITVLTALKFLEKHFVIEKDVVHSALQKVKKIAGLHGRWEVIQTRPAIVLDVAHNIEGVRQLLNQALQTPCDQLHLIFGMVKDKDIDNILALMPRQARYYFTNAHIPRALPAEDLKNKALRHQLLGEHYDDVNIALSIAKKVAGSHDLIIIFGSVFVVGEVTT